MAVWYSTNYLALAAHGPDEDPLVEFDMPALEVRAREMMICLLVNENQK